MNEIIAAFTQGTLAILTNACLLPLYPGLIAFLAGNAGSERSRQAAVWLGLPVLGGVLTMMILIGLLFAVLSLSFANILPILLPAIYLLVIGMGVLLLIGKNPFARLQSAQAPMFKNPYLSAFMYGLLLAPMTLPCTGPLLVGAFAFSAGIGDIANALVYFLFFGLGFGWPLVVLPLLAMPLQRRFVGWLAQHHTILSAASGVLLIAVGIFGIITELLPHIAPDFFFDTPLQLAYWGVTLVLVVALFYVLLRRSMTAES